MARKYEGMIHYFTPEDTDFGPWSHSPQPFLHGERDLRGALEATERALMLLSEVRLREDPSVQEREKELQYRRRRLKRKLASQTEAGGEKEQNINGIWNHAEGQ